MMENDYPVSAAQIDLTFNTDLLEAIELGYLLDLAEVTAESALARQESRGSHFRTDFPQRDDARWLHHTIATLEGDEIRLSSAEVDISKYEPKQRTY